MVYVCTGRGNGEKPTQEKVLYMKAKPHHSLKWIVEFWVEIVSSGTKYCLESFEILSHLVRNTVSPVSKYCLDWSEALSHLERYIVSLSSKFVSFGLNILSRIVRNIVTPGSEYYLAFFEILSLFGLKHCFTCFETLFHQV